MADFVKYIPHVLHEGVWRRVPEWDEIHDRLTVAGEGGNMVILGIDCASSCGYFKVSGTVESARCVDRGVLELGGVSTWAQILGLAKKSPYPDLVVIETPYLGKNPATTIKLAMMAGQFVQAFGGCMVLEVRATQWQRSILGKFGGKARDGLKKASLLWAKATYGGLFESDDVSDAAAIATYGLRMFAFAKKVEAEQVKASAPAASGPSR